MEIPRRRFVRYTGAAGVGVVAGCLDDGNGDDEDSDSDEDEDEREDDEDDTDTTDGDGGGVTVVETEFEVVESGGGTRGAEASIEFDGDEETVTVEGVVQGNNSCYTAELGDDSYEADRDLYTADVVSFDESDEDEMCAQVILEIEYRLVARFDGGLPATVEISHNGDRVAGADSGM